jgi:kynurenine formamidase
LKAKITIHNKLYEVDLSKPLDISLPLLPTVQNPEAWYLGPPVMEPVKFDDWVGKVSEGASVNFNNIIFNPHAHGTHTECVGHISKDFHSVNDALKQFFFLAEVISVTPEIKGEDSVITAKQLKQLLGKRSPEAVVIRTMPNSTSKKTRKYSNTNWPYLEGDAARFLRDSRIQHLLIDLPSVDKERDKGKLAAHKEFWNFPEAIRYDATITEFIYVPDKISDGSYLLSLQPAPFHNDASPSKPVLYKLL